MIYFDHAATSFPKIPRVIQGVVRGMELYGNPSRGSYDAALEGGRLLHRARQKIANMFGEEDSRRVAFTKNVTESLNIVIQGSLHSGDHVLTTVAEHNSVLRPLYLMEKRGVTHTHIGVDSKGRLRLEELERSLRPNTTMMVVSHASNVTGNLTDLTWMGEFCGKHNLRLVVDAAQTAGIFPIDMKKMNIHALCFTGHKTLLGPQGTGGLCLREGFEISPLIVGGSGVESFLKEQPSAMPTLLEGGTQNLHGIAGLLEGIKFIEDEGADILREREDGLARRFYEGVRNIPGLRFYGDMEAKTRAPIVSLNLGDRPSEEVCEALYCHDAIATRGGVHCAPLLHKAFGTERQGMVRFSFSHSNTEEEVETGIQALWKIAEDFKG